jgi:hypothetical protein
MDFANHNCIPLGVNDDSTVAEPYIISCKELIFENPTSRLLPIVNKELNLFLSLLKRLSMSRTLRS